MEKYLFQLIEQFKSATGTKHVDIYSQEFITEFSEWIRQRKMIGTGYRTFIEYLGAISNPEDSCVEIGKGRHDSIVLETGVPMITPYSEGIKRADGSIITANFEVYNGEPRIIIPGENNYILNGDDPQCFRRFITQNPYNEHCISNWEQLHNSGRDITVGVFGSIYDRDMAQKMREIELLRDQLTDGDYTEDYEVDGDMYYYAVSSNNRYVLVYRPRKPKKLEGVAMVR